MQTNLIGQSLGRYHIIDKLGAGGMATVYKAFDTRLERPVAIKIIRADQDHEDTFLKRFEREAKALALLSHPNILKILDYGDYEGMPYLVMEFMSGGTLRNRTGSLMPFTEAAHLLIPIALALEYAHQHKIIHRDIKPANILITESGEPMLSDFGIAKMVESTSDLTGTGVGIGTPEYMAPEQGLGKNIDQRVDIYALGVVFYELVTGQKPFRADTPLAVLLKQINDPLPRPKMYVPDIPEEVEMVIIKALAKDPDDRYASAADLANALKRLEIQSNINKPFPESSSIREQATMTRNSAPVSPAALPPQPVVAPNLSNSVPAAPPQMLLRLPFTGSTPQPVPVSQPFTSLENKPPSGEGAPQYRASAKKGVSKWIIGGGIGCVVVLMIGFAAAAALIANSLGLFTPSTAVARGTPRSTSTPRPSATSANTQVVATEKPKLPTASSTVYEVTLTPSPTAEISTEIPTVVPTGTEVPETILPVFGKPYPIISDLRVRRAMAYCTDKLGLLRVGYPSFNDEELTRLIAVSFMSPLNWAYSKDDVMLYPYDPEKGKALLEEAGWSGSSGQIRTDASGNKLLVKFYTTTAQFRQNYAAEFEAQMKQCGIQVERHHEDAGLFFGRTDNTGLKIRDFELGAFAWILTDDPGGFSVFHCSQIPTADNGWAGQNYTGWCRGDVDQAIITAANAMAMNDRRTAYHSLLRAYSRDVPVLPLFYRAAIFAFNRNLTGPVLVTGHSYAYANIHEWSFATSDLLKIGIDPAYEPGGLLEILDQSTMTVQANTLIYGRYFWSNSYNIKPLLGEIPTFENGRVTAEVVEVSASQKVYSPNGSVDLSDGTQVVDADGNWVTFSGSPIKMRQLKVKYVFNAGLTWSDGQKVTADDFMLYYNIYCDKDILAQTTNSFFCDLTQSIDFDDHGYTITYLPGYAELPYTTAPYGYFPAHQVIQTGNYKGKLLKDVPAVDWNTLTEINEKPLSAGPYVLKQWIKGQKMVFEANPNYALGIPRIKQVIFVFASSDTLPGMLVKGDVDFIGSESLFEVSTELRAEARSGTISIVVAPSETYEHIDIKLIE